MKQVRVILAATAVTLLIGGCTVTPVAITTEELEQQRDADLAEIFSAQEPIEKPITLYEAIARALKYNLDQRLKIMEEALARGELEVVQYDLLPQLTAEAGYHWRNNEPGASSESLITGTESLEPSKSIEREYYDANLTLSWNILDFGVSYVRARQQADQVLIMQERRRKVAQNVIQDVRYAYWRAVSAEQLLPEMDDMLELAEDALERSKQLETLRLQSPLTPLRYQKSLLDLVSRLWKLREDLSTAKTELAALINVMPGTQFELADEGDDMVSTPLPVYTPADELVQLALVQRPELIEENYKRRISELEVRKAMLEMLPGLQLDVGPQYQDNRFLYNQGWVQASAGISWNIFKLFSGPKRKKLAEAKGELADMRRMALNMAVMTQVQLAYQRYHLAIKNNQIATEQDSVESRIRKHVVMGQRADREHALEVLRARTAALVASMRRHIAYAEVQNSLGRLYNSVGYDPLPGKVEDHSIATLAAAIQTRLEELPASL
ncbi:MAG: TolC family protein [Gammaproteobacteria bacterium]|jgi:outer membrane protein TolC